MAFEKLSFGSVKYNALSSFVISPETKNIK